MAGLDPSVVRYRPERSRDASLGSGPGRRPGGKAYPADMAISGLTTFLWFDDEALEAAEFYVGLFADSTLGEVQRYPDGTPNRPPGSVLTVNFRLFGQEFVALNGGPQFPHSEAVSFMVSCATQDELDFVWDSLIADGGSESQCGWCKDRFGVSWQVVPETLGQLLSAGAWPAMMSMKRLDIAALEAATGLPSQ